MDEIKLPAEYVKKMLVISKQFKEISETIEELCHMVKTISKKDDIQPELPFEEKEEEKKPSVTLEQVRGLLAAKSRDGFTAEVRSLITKYGADRLSEIDPKNYEAVIKEAEGIGHAG